MTVGKGCFKCGAPDHMARECTGSSTGQPPSKYILKEDNAQRGGDDSRFVPDTAPLSLSVLAYVCGYACMACMHLCASPCVILTV